MSITFSGLASGVDTASIIDELIEVERAPIDSAEEKIEYYEMQEEVYNEFDSMLESFNLSVMSLNAESDLQSFEVTNSASDVVSVTTTSITDAGSFKIEVLSLAERQKDIANEGYADSDTTLLTGSLEIGDETIEYEGITLADLRDLINEGNYGLSSTIINNGTNNGYHLVFTADTAGEEIPILGTGDLTIDTETNGHTITGTQAHALIDGIDYYSSSNSITSAVKGTTLELLDISDSGASRVTIASDAESVISTQIEEIVNNFNEMISFVGSYEESDSTVARAMETVTSNLKNYLTSSEFLDIGISSDWETGTLSFDSSVLSEAYADDPDGVIESLVGNDDVEGGMTRLDDYVNKQISSTTGFLATKSSSLNSKISDLEDYIERMETRLEKRQETLEAQFTAMETLISSLNTQGDYLESFFSSSSS